MTKGKENNLLKIFNRTDEDGCAIGEAGIGAFREVF